MSYTKLFQSIITSTIWSENDQTRIVWITLMALADKNGEVQGSVPGIARLAGVSVDACRESIGKFLSPDPDSRTKDDGGRRIEVIDGGWFLVNHKKYREMASDADRLEKAASRQKRFRDKVNRNATVTLPSRNSNGGVTQELHQNSQAEAEADTEAQEKEREKTLPPAHEVVPTGRRFPDTAAIMARINKVRPEWGKPAHWSGKEMHALSESLAQFEELTDSDWDSIIRYMAASLPEGGAFWKPKGRGQLVENFSDVFGHVQRWEDKRRPSPTIPKTSAPVKEREILTREQLKEMMKP